MNARAQTGRGIGKLTKRLGAALAGGLGALGIGGCPPVAVGIAIAATSIPFVLGVAGIIDAKAGVTARSGGVVSLPLGGASSDQPANGTLELNVGTTRVLPLGGTAKSTTAQSLTGSATVRVFIAESSSDNPCDDGDHLGAFQLQFAGGQVTVANPKLALTRRALNACASGEFTICLEVVATIDVRVVIEEMTVSFGPVEGEPAPVEPPDIEPVDTTPPVNEPPVNEPPVNEPPVNEPPVNEPPVDGFVPATVVHQGYEQLVAGTDIDPAFGLVYTNDRHPNVYNFDEWNRSVVLSGDGNRVWFRLRGSFPDADTPAVELWSISSHGAGAMKSALPSGDDLNGGLHLATSNDGSVCVANNTRAQVLYRAAPGQAAAWAVDYHPAALDIRGNFAIDGTGTTVYMLNLFNPGLHSAPIGGSAALPTQVAAKAALQLNGIEPRSMDFEIDTATDMARTVFNTDHYSGSLTPNHQKRTWAWSGSGPALNAFLTQAGDQRAYDLNITDDGQTIGYCLFSEGINGENECYVERIDGTSKVRVGDRRSRVGGLRLSDNGKRVYYRTDIAFGSGYGILEDVGAGTKVPAGTQALYSSSKPDLNNVQISDDGTVLAAAVNRGVYVLHDRQAPPASFPAINSIAYRLNDDCTMTIRVSVTAPRGVERIFVNPYYDGVDPTVWLPGEENPAYAIRSGGGVNWSTRFTEVDGQPGVWEYTFGLTNDSNACVADLLDSSIRFRVIVRDANETLTVFQDFAVGV